MVNQTVSRLITLQDRLLADPQRIRWALHRGAFTKDGLVAGTATVAVEPVANGLDGIGLGQEDVVPADLLEVNAPGQPAVHPFLRLARIQAAAVHAQQA